VNLQWFAIVADALHEQKLRVRARRAVQRLRA
jgi:hypothetical protein